MQISLRSHLIAGTAAVVGASAIAMTPVMGAQLSLPAINVPTVAKVTLAPTTAAVPAIRCERSEICTVIPPVSS